MCYCGANFKFLNIQGEDLIVWYPCCSLLIMLSSVEISDYIMFLYCSNQEWMIYFTITYLRSFNQETVIEILIRVHYRQQKRYQQFCLSCFGLFSVLTHFSPLIPGRGRRSGSVVSKSFCRLHLLAAPAVPACPGPQDRAISLWVCLLVAFRGSPCPSLV